MAKKKKLPKDKVEIKVPGKNAVIEYLPPVTADMMNFTEKDIVNSIYEIINDNAMDFCNTMACEDFQKMSLNLTKENEFNLVFDSQVITVQLKIIKRK